MFMKKLFEYLRSNRQKKLPLKILAWGTGSLLLITWVVTSYITIVEMQRQILKWVVINWLFFSGFAWLIMAVRQEFVQIITIRGPFAFFLGLGLGLGFWFVAILFYFML